MKILFASSSSGSHGGGELCLLYLARACRQRGHQVELWSSTNPRMDGLCAKFAVIGSVHRLDYPNTYYDRPLRSVAAYFDRSVPAKVAVHWKSIGPDVIHLNKQNLEDGLDLVAAARLAGIPSICMIHITQPARWLGARFGGIRDAVAGRSLRSFPGPLVTTPETRAESLRAVVGARQDIRVIHNGVPPSAQGDTARNAKRSELAIPTEATLFVEVARLEPQKNPFKFIELATQAIQSGSSAHFLWVGSGSLESAWQKTIHDRSLENRIHHVPWTDETGAWLSAADAFLHTADFEGMPFAVLEALAAGLPVLLQKSLIEEIPPFDAGGIIPLDQRLDWLSKIENPSSRVAAAEAAHRLYTEKFSIEQTAEQYESLYREVIDAKAKPSN